MGDCWGSSFPGVLFRVMRGGRPRASPAGGMFCFCGTADVVTRLGVAGHDLQEFGVEELGPEA